MPVKATRVSHLLNDTPSESVSEIRLIIVFVTEFVRLPIGEPLVADHCHELPVVSQATRFEVLDDLAGPSTCNSVSMAT